LIVPSDIKHNSFLQNNYISSNYLENCEVNLQEPNKIINIM